MVSSNISGFATEISPLCNSWPKHVEAIENAIKISQSQGYGRFQVKKIGISKCRKALANGEDCTEFWASRGVAI